MEIMGIGSVAAITVICYLVGRTVKQTPLDNKWIPSIVGFLGMILGIVGWKVVADYPANDILTALAVGVVSGLASTGADQVVKQFASAEEKPVIKIPAYEKWDENGDPVSKEGDKNDLS